MGHVFTRPCYTSNLFASQHRYTIRRCHPTLRDADQRQSEHGAHDDEHEVDDREGLDGAWRAGASDATSEEEEEEEERWWATGCGKVVGGRRPGRVD